MGFKDLACFSDALLAKRAWRLLHNRNSLFYQVFKSKIFPSCSILEAPDSSIGSYVWHSILRGKDVLWRGPNGELVVGTLLVSGWISGCLRMINLEFCLQ